MVLSSFLLTEVVAYPAFCWALLALTVATARRTALTDALALASIALAVLARTQFLLLLPVLAMAVAADALFESIGRCSRRAAAKLVANAQAAARRVPRPGAHRRRARPGGRRVAASRLVRHDDGRASHSTSTCCSSRVQQLAVLALGLAILPFLAGTAWLLEQLRPSAPVARAGIRRRGLRGCRAARSPGGRVQPSTSARGRSRTATSSTPCRSCSSRSRRR